MRATALRVIAAMMLLGTGGCLSLEEEDFYGEGALADLLDGGMDAAARGAITTARDGGRDAAQDAGRGPRPCSDLFDARQLRTYDLQISAVELATLTDEFMRPVLNEYEDGFLHPWHPVELRLGAESVEAQIRLKGDSSWAETVAQDANPKAQFVIAFDRKDKAARFHGVDRLELDMPRTDPTYLRERVGHHMMRQLGLPGMCAASARLNINGRYYGLYVALEDLRREALRRIYPEAPNGPLWSNGVELETSASAADVARQQAWEQQEDIPSMLKIIDMEQALSVWAAEIVLNDADGYYGGDHNFFTYDHPQRGFVWLPTDLDSTFDYIAWTTHPVYWWEDHDGEQTAGHHYRAVITDPYWRSKLVDAVAAVMARWNVPQIQRLIDTWSTQVAPSIRQDPHRWLTLRGVRRATAALRETVQRRPEYLASWVRCERENRGTDADQDGVPWCKDCNDQRPEARPGAPEICGNELDENCNGLKDEGCP